MSIRSHVRTHIEADECITLEKSRPPSWNCPATCWMIPTRLCVAPIIRLVGLSDRSVTSANGSYRLMIAACGIMCAACVLARPILLEKSTYDQVDIQVTSAREFAWVTQ